jgi:hypothetical protein
MDVVALMDDGGEVEEQQQQQRVATTTTTITMQHYPENTTICVSEFLHTATQRFTTITLWTTSSSERFYSLS